MNTETNCFKGYNIKATTNEDGTVNVETGGTRTPREHGGTVPNMHKASSTPEKNTSSGSPTSLRKSSENDHPAPSARAGHN